jgi:sugar phosphate isomerase/epimerase
VIPAFSELLLRSADCRIGFEQNGVQTIHEAGARLHNVHMKDFADFQAKDSQVGVGDGILPVRKMFEALIATKYKGFVDLEYEIHPEDPMPGVRSRFACLHLDHFPSLA